MSKNSYEYETEPAARPSFLTWLCILTFIGSSWAIISSVYTYISAQKYANILSEQKPLQADSLYRDSTGAVHNEKKVFSEKIKASFSKILDKDNMRKLAVGNLIAALFTLAGALFMWRLRRTGFYIYIIGVIIGLTVPFFLFGNDMIAVGATSFNNFFGLVFIALYALNLRAMNGRYPGVSNVG
jgi:hypothetical protein